MLKRNDTKSIVVTETEKFYDISQNWPRSLRLILQHHRNDKRQDCQHENSRWNLGEKRRRRTDLKPFEDPAPKVVKGTHKTCITQTKNRRSQG